MEIKLFTFGPCPLGRNMAKVLQEVKELMTDWQYSVHHLDDTPELARRFHVQENPTVIYFRNGVEVYRFTGFKETEDVIALGQKIASGELSTGETAHFKPSDTWQPTMEKYVLHFLRGDDIFPQEVTYENVTGVKTPRITAVQLQCRIRPQGMVNPIREGTRLLAIDFDRETALLSFNQNPVREAEQEWAVEQVLEKTLAPYGIQEVKWRVRKQG